MPQTGRPSKLTPERQQQLVDLIAAGNYLETACAGANIDYSTFRSWILRGQELAHNREFFGMPAPPALPKGRLSKRRRAEHAAAYAAWEAERAEEQRFIDFSEAIAKAENDAEVAAVVGWQTLTAAKGDWRGYAEFLARRWGDRWSPRQRIDGKWTVDEDALNLIFDIIARAVTDQATLDRIRDEFAKLAQEA